MANYDRRQGHKYKRSGHCFSTLMSIISSLKIMNCETHCLWTCTYLRNGIKAHTLTRMSILPLIHRRLMQKCPRHGFTFPATRIRKIHRHARVTCTARTGATAAATFALLGAHCVLLLLYMWRQWRLFAVTFICSDVYVWKSVTSVTLLCVVDRGLRHWFLLSIKWIYFYLIDIFDM